MTESTSEIRKQAIAGIQAGDCFEVQRTFTTEETRQFGELTRDANPVHYSTAFARDKGFRSTVLHGLLTGSMLCEVGGQIGWLATQMDFSFKRPVYAGDTITCRLTVTAVAPDGIHAKARVEYFNQDGELVLCADLAGHLPSPAQQRIMGER